MKINYQNEKEKLILIINSYEFLAWLTADFNAALKDSYPSNCQYKHFLFK